MSLIRKIIPTNNITTGNTTTTPLGIDGVFTGEWVDTVDYGTAVVGVCTDQDSATDGLEIQYSSDGVNVCQSDVFTVVADIGKVFSVGMSNRYLRVVYTNGGVAQTSFDLQTILKNSPIKNSSHRINDSIVAEDDAELIKSVITGEDPDGTFRNVEVELSGALKTGLVDGQTGRRAEVEALGSLKTITPIRLVGTTFSNGTKDTNFWTEAVTGSGSVAQAGQIVLSTGTTADSTAKYYTVANARKVTGTTNEFRAVGQLTTDPEADNIRRIGAYDTNDGYFFQINGTTFQVGTRNSTVDTLVSSGSFNGNLGASLTIDTTVKKLSIQYTALSARFFVDDILLHTVTGSAGPLVNSQNLPVTMENINSNGNTTDNSFAIRFATILRLGELITASKAVYIGTNTTTVLKYNAGRLIRIVNLDNAGTVTVYDNTAGSGTQLAVIDTAKALGTLDFEADFSTGLTVVTESGAKITIIYE